MLKFIFLCEGILPPDRSDPDINISIFYLPATTITLTVVLSSAIASFAYPASFVHARVCIAAVVSAVSIMLSAASVIHVSSIPVHWNVLTTVITSTSLAVAFASSWAVGVMSLIEKETNRVGFKVTKLVWKNNHNYYNYYYYYYSLS